MIFVSVHEVFKCVVPKLDGGDVGRFTKIGADKTISHIDFAKDEDPLNTGYSELDGGDRGSPWWERKHEGTIDGASIREQEVVPMLVAIHHNTDRAHGPHFGAQEFCLQYATKITRRIVQYIELECGKSLVCSEDGLLFKCSEEEEKNRRCGRRVPLKFKLNQNLNLIEK